jgi:PAS domain S-box-containing protein
MLPASAQKTLKIPSFGFLGKMSKSLGFLVILAALTLIAMVVHWSISDSRSQARTQLVSASYNLSTNISYALRAVELVLSTATNQLSAPNKTLNLKPFLEEISARLPPIKTITIISPDGTIQTDLRASQPSRGVSVADRDYFKVHLNRQTEGYFYSPPITSREDGKMQITMSRAARAPNGALIAVVVVSIDDRFFSRITNDMEQMHIYEADIVYRDGRIIYPLISSSPDHMITPLWMAMLADLMGHDPWIESPSLTIPHSDLDVALRLQRSVYLYAALDRSWQPVLFIMLITIAFVFFDRFRRRAQDRHHQSMAENIRLNTRLRTLYHAAPDAIITVDSHQAIIEFNKVAETLFGWSADEALGMPLSALLPEKARAEHHRSADYFLRKSRQSPYQMAARTVKGLHRDGHEFHVRVSIATVKLESGIAATAIVRDVNELERMNSRLIALSQDLEAQSRRAEEANQAKSQFLATMSHELRTPLNAIIGFSELIQREIYGPISHQRYEGYISDIRHSGEHLLSLINDVLDLARLESGESALEFESVSTRMAIGQAIKQVRGLGKSQGLRLRVRVPRTIAAIHGNRRAVHQILLNLLSNAIKFTPAGGRILVTASPTADGKIRLIVDDEGCGIPADKINILGQPFRSLSGNSHHANETGMGLGLAISMRLSREMGGSLEIRSIEGAGTKVIIHLIAVSDDETIKNMIASDHQKAPDNASEHIAI